MYLSDRGYDVTILDNLSRRKIDVNLEVGSLTPITAIGDRLRTWREVSGRLIDFVNLDLATEYDRLIAILRELRPDAIVHFAQQRAAPYSMRSPATKRYTVDNVRATHNLLAALVHTGIDAAIAHLGTMGVYGYDSPSPPRDSRRCQEIGGLGASVRRTPDVSVGRRPADCPHGMFGERAITAA